MERVPDVACLALEKAMQRKDERPDNLRFLIGDARNLAEWFAPHSVDCIYLNFSDPWPKKGYAKRRLTHVGFLELYRKVLRRGGVLKLKTDNVGLFDFSLEQFVEAGLRIDWQTRNLHASEKAADNIMTEYERNFSEKGQAICSAWVTFVEKENA
jgi:tRNA (guanine-N7-)-methyltransferase